MSGFEAGSLSFHHITLASFGFACGRRALFTESNELNFVAFFRYDSMRFGFVFRGSLGLVVARELFASVI
jgi:hypothetical protein